MNIKTILIDDESKSLQVLKSKLERFCPSIEIVGITQDPIKGMEMIKSLKPQLVFLDIDMPEMTGFDLLSKFEHPEFEVIFATAYNSYAIEAIKHCAIGYLVKPIDNDDLVVSVEHATDNIRRRSALEKNQQLILNLKEKDNKKRKVAIPIEGGLRFISINEIIHCEGVKGYTKICLISEEEILSSRSIGHYSKLLSNQYFYHVHKSHLINLAEIIQYLNEGIVLLSNHREIPVSRNRKNHFLDVLRNL